MSPYMKYLPPHGQPLTKHEPEIDKVSFREMLVSIEFFMFLPAVLLI